MPKTALLTGAAGLLLMTAPAVAQDGTAPQTPPATPPAQQAQAPTLTLQPGMTVRGGDGDLGALVGARTVGGSQQLTVKGSDGQIRAVPIDGIRQEGDVVVVDFTLEQFGTAETITEPTTPAEPGEPADSGVIPAPPSTPAVPGIPAPPPTAPVAPADDATPPPAERPVSPPPILPPENPAEPEAPPAPTAATPVPGEGTDQEPDGGS
jgi:hypothetical protein